MLLCDVSSKKFLNEKISSCKQRERGREERERKFFRLVFHEKIYFWDELWQNNIALKTVLEQKRSKMAYHSYLNTPSCFFFHIYIVRLISIFF